MLTATRHSGYAQAMYFRSFSICGRTVVVEAPDGLGRELRALFGRSERPHSDDGTARIAISKSDGGRYRLEAPFSRPAEDLDASNALLLVLEEVVRSLVFDLESGLALHAGALGWRNKLVAVAGPSQAGKSSFVAWLASKGFDYLSDELVVVAGEGEAEALMRPLVVKPGSRQAVAGLSFGKSGKMIEIDQNLAIMPERGRVRHPVRHLALVVFVQYAEGAELAIEPVSTARTVSRLMGCNLNARNLPDHGLAMVRELAGTIPAIVLRYGAYNQLDGVADRLIRMIVADGWRASDASRLLSAFGSQSSAGGGVTTMEPSREKAFPIPSPTPKRAGRKLTIGMATYDDFDGVYFTIQALRMFHAEAMDDVTFLVVDNRPDGPCGEPLKTLENSIDNYRYVPFVNRTGTMIRDAVFEEADSPYVLCLDCHVMIVPGGLRRLLGYYNDHPDCRDLLQGPLIYDNLTKIATHFEPVWGAGMYGRWVDGKQTNDSEAKDLDAEPFEIPMQGLGLFSCRKDAWPGFNRAFRGFGGEEGYIHEKFRQAGARTLCLPFLRWLHRFQRPLGVPYPLNWEDRIRNYLAGFGELGLPTAEMEEHFKELLGEGTARQLIRQTRKELSQSG